MKINHIGYLVENLEKSINEFVILGYNSSSQITHDTKREVDIIFMKNDKYVVELIAPYSTSSVVAGMLKKYRNMPYHICYETLDMDEKISELIKDGYIILQQPESAPALGGDVAFLFKRHIGIIELLENKL